MIFMFSTGPDLYRTYLKAESELTTLNLLGTGKLLRDLAEFGETAAGTFREQMLEECHDCRDGHFETLEVHMNVLIPYIPEQEWKLEHYSRFSYERHRVLIPLVNPKVLRGTYSYLSDDVFWKRIDKVSIEPLVGETRKRWSYQMNEHTPVTVISDSMTQRFVDSVKVTLHVGDMEFESFLTDTTVNYYVTLDGMINDWLKDRENIYTNGTFLRGVLYSCPECWEMNVSDATEHVKERAFAHRRSVSAVGISVDERILEYFAPLLMLSLVFFFRMQVANLWHLSRTWDENVKIYPWFGLIRTEWSWFALGLSVMGLPFFVNCFLVDKYVEAGSLDALFSVVCICLTTYLGYKALRDLWDIQGQVKRAQFY